MAFQTDKFNTTTFITNNAPPVTNWTNPTVVVRDTNGKVISAADVDPVTNQAIYRRTLTQADIGQNNLAVEFTGGGNLAGGGTDSFTSHIGSSTAATVPGVTQIVAGPGIYISAPNGKGVVTISTEPIPTTLTQDDLYDVRWTISDPNNIPDVGDQSQFTVVGKNGINLRSRDGDHFVVMGTPNIDKVNLSNAVTLQSKEFGGGGTVYWDAVATIDINTNELIYISNVWGRLANTSTTGVITGDGLNIEGSHFKVSGAEITGQIPNYCDTIYKSGSFADALHLFGTYEGAIYRTSLPINYYNFYTNDGNDVPFIAHKEYDSSGVIALGEMANNLSDHSTSSYRVVFAGSVGSAGGIVYSDRVSNNSGTWTKVDAPYSLDAIAYGNGHWVAAGANDCVGYSTDGSTWTWITSKWPGSAWLSATYGNGTFVLVGRKGRVVYSTDNGLTWTRGQSGTNNNLNAIAYSPSLNKFVAVGDKRTIVTVNG